MPDCDHQIIRATQSNKSIVWTTSGVPALRQRGLITSLLQLELKDAVSFLLSLLVNAPGLPRCVDREPLQPTQNSAPIAASTRLAPSPRHRGKPSIWFGLSQRYTGEVPRPPYTTGKRRPHWSRTAAAPPRPAIHRRSAGSGRRAGERALGDGQTASRAWSNNTSKLRGTMAFGLKVPQRDVRRR